MPLQLSGGKAPVPTLRPLFERARDACAELNEVIRQLEIISASGRLYDKQEAWLERHKGHENWPRNKAMFLRTEATIKTALSALHAASKRIEQEVGSWTGEEREMWLRAWQVPWPCTWELDANQLSYEWTPWREFPPF